MWHHQLLCSSWLNPFWDWNYYTCEPCIGPFLIIVCLYGHSLTPYPFADHSLCEFILRVSNFARTRCTRMNLITLVRDRNSSHSDAVTCQWLTNCCRPHVFIPVTMFTNNIASYLYHLFFYLIVFAVMIFENDYYRLKIWQWYTLMIIVYLALRVVVN